MHVNINRCIFESLTEAVCLDGHVEKMWNKINESNLLLYLSRKFAVE